MFLCVCVMFPLFRISSNNGQWVLSPMGVLITLCVFCSLFPGPLPHLSPPDGLVPCYFCVSSLSEALNSVENIQMDSEKCSVKITSKNTKLGKIGLNVRRINPD